MEGLVVIFWIILSFVIASWNKIRGNSYILGLALALLLSPIVAFIIIVITKKNIKVIEDREINSGKMKKCPQCAELVKFEAKKCRYCGAELSININIKTGEFLKP